MPSMTALIAFLITVTVVIAIPGPSVLFTIGRALTIGRRGALLTVLGNTLGLYVQLIFVSLGLGALVERSESIYLVVRIAGAAYLIYLGVQAIRHRHLASAAASTTAPRSTFRIVREGFVVGITNPKMLIFMTAVMPQFVNRNAGNVPAQMLVLGIAMALIAMTADSIWALAAGTAREWFASSPRRIERMGGAGGVAMIGLGTSFLALGGHES